MAVKKISGYKHKFESYSDITAFVFLDSDQVSDRFVAEISVVDELALEAGVELHLSRLVVSSWNCTGRRLQCGLAVGLAIYVFALDAWNVTSIA